MTTWEKVWVGISIVTAVVLIGPFCAFAATTPMADTQQFAPVVRLVNGPQGWYPYKTPPPYKITEDVPYLTSGLRPGEQTFRCQNTPSMFLTNTMDGAGLYEWWVSVSASGHAAVTTHEFAGTWRQGAITAAESGECSGAIYFVEWDRVNKYPFSPITYSAWADDQVWNWGGGSNKFYIGLGSQASDRFSSTYPTNNYRGLRGHFRQLVTDVVASPTASAPLDGQRGFMSIHRALVLAERTSTGWDLTAKLWGTNRYLGHSKNSTYTIHSWSVEGVELRPDFTITGSYQAYAWNLSSVPHANPAEDSWISQQYVENNQSFSSQMVYQDDSVTMSTARYHTAADARTAWGLITIDTVPANLSDVGTDTPDGGPGTPPAPNVDDGGVVKAVRDLGDRMSAALNDWLWFVNPWERLTENY